MQKEKECEDRIIEQGCKDTFEFKIKYMKKRKAETAFDISHFRLGALPHPSPERMLPRVASRCTLRHWGLLGAALARLLLSKSPTFSHHPLTLETSVGKVPRSWEGCTGSVHLCINWRFLGAHHLALCPSDFILHSPVNDQGPLPLFSLNQIRELLETQPSFFCPPCSNDSSYFSSTSQCNFLNYLAILIDILPTVMLGGFPVPKKHDSSCTKPHHSTAFQQIFAESSHGKCINTIRI